MRIGAIDTINKQQVEQIRFLYFGSSFSYRPSIATLVPNSHVILQFLSL